MFVSWYIFVFRNTDNNDFPGCRLQINLGEICQQMFLKHTTTITHECVRTLLTCRRSGLEENVPGIFRFVPYRKTCIHFPSETKILREIWRCTSNPTNANGTIFSLVIDACVVPCVRVWNAKKTIVIRKNDKSMFQRLLSLSPSLGQFVNTTPVS